MGGWGLGGYPDYVVLAKGPITTAALKGHVKKIFISFPRHNYLVPTT